MLPLLAFFGAGCGHEPRDRSVIAGGQTLALLLTLPFATPVARLSSTMPAVQQASVASRPPPSGRKVVHTRRRVSPVPERDLAGRGRAFRRLFHAALRPDSPSWAAAITAAASAATAANLNVTVLSGRLEAPVVDLAPKVAGRVVEVKVREGDRVKAGDLLARLDLGETALAPERDARGLQSAEARFNDLRVGAQEPGGSGGRGRLSPTRRPPLNSRDESWSARRPFFPRK